uniref:non-specific serine/threonine protein kinase n=1 Tax=Nothoprocta perdicaria TaxID=30464 RepID=A0A8C6YYY3_NOTPE
MQEGGIYPYLFRILRPAILACRGLRRALRGLRRLLRGRAGSGDVMAEAAPATTPGVLARFGYELEGLLGHCVYGKVYRARARQGHAQVAIKVISKKKATQQYLRELLPRHIQLWKGVHHKHLITLYQAIETSSKHYIVMELAPAGNVLQRVQSQGPCSEQQAGLWFSQLVLCLVYLHSRAIVHRDLKMENLLLDSKDNVKLSLLGFPRSMAVDEVKGESVAASAPEGGSSGKILSQTFCGSYAYACLEILQAQPYNPYLADTWSAGVILYAMLLGELPFDDTNLWRLQKQAKHAPVLVEEDPMPNACKVGLGGQPGASRTIRGCWRQLWGTEGNHPEDLSSATTAPKK